MEITRKELLIMLYHMCYYLNEHDNKCVRDFCNYLYDKYESKDRIIFIGIKD